MTSGTGRVRPRRARTWLAAHVMLLPWLVGALGITIGPLIASLVLSLTNYSILGSTEFVGLDNYAAVFSDPKFFKSMSVTLMYVCLAVPLQLGLALGLALLLEKGIRWLGVYRAGFYLPSLLGASVAIALLWRQIFKTDGLVNAVLSIFGVTGRNWLYDPDTALLTLVLLQVWTFGSPMIIFLAGLKEIPKELIEAATVDGAGYGRRLKSIVLPLLTPMIFFNLILQTVGAFQAFNQAYIVSGGTGGPVDSTLFYTLYVYIVGFIEYRMGYASALAWVLVIFIGILTAVQFIVSRKWVYYGDQ
ncbi:carbohydrate ABC transporter permease [Occultella gossypii]|uniref:Sugar ABC transporter permease n=1 Tax=Occultella gossypii TaxID=2800820 RepID=A0ABS7SC60_9MICO|nr:sugar ABC transporter permease [Occultella gossypii]MBZ2197942.1 sugar ABC transporter permease [Occultella gossypii]